MHYTCCVAFLNILCISLPVNLQATKLGTALKWNGALITFRFRLVCIYTERKWELFCPLLYIPIYLQSQASELT